MRLYGEGLESFMGSKWQVRTSVWQRTLIAAQLPQPSGGSHRLFSRAAADASRSALPSTYTHTVCVPTAEVFCAHPFDTNAL